MKKNHIPDPLILAVLLTFITMVLAFLYNYERFGVIENAVNIISWWNKGIWDLLAFTMQMVLILLLGYMIAISPLLERLSDKLIRFTERPVTTAMIVIFTSLTAGLLNWGLALVFSAIFVKKIGLQAQLKKQKINYPLLGASAYVCMMVWHGGLSGSAPLTVATAGNFLEAKTGIVSLNRTIFSSMNLLATVLIFTIIPVLTWIIAKKSIGHIPVFDKKEIVSTAPERHKQTKLSWMRLTGIFIIIGLIVRTLITDKSLSFGLNEINLLLFGFVLILLPESGIFTRTASAAISSTSGIILQFPLYAGIMGLMRQSGLLEGMTQWFISVSNADTFPVMAFLSAAIVNLFVPSGGGQWAVQGPLLADAATALGVDPAKAVMALAYGDQLTNMMQPFWALPLLAITELKAGQFIRYSLLYMLLGLIIFTFVLL